MPRILHLGLGNFHRAHQAWYTAHGTDWKITGVVMRNETLFDQLAQTGNAFVLGTWGQDGLSAEILRVYDHVILASRSPERVIDTLAEEETQVVTLTITEKGYHLAGPMARLNFQAAPIKADLDAGVPATALGLLAAGLIKRSQTDAGPLTIVSCDNLAQNGDKLCGAVREFLAQKSPETVAWLEEKVTFPNTMVDRITPRLTPEAAQEIAFAAAAPELSVVGTETFSEWIIEDQFAGHRPSWNKAGALFVGDVRPFEERKLRLLNAAHSYLAYSGLLAGHRFVHEAINDPTLRAGVEALWGEAQETVSAPASETIDAYCDALRARFAVPAMRHDLAQIAMDGSLKLRERLVPIHRELMRRGLTSPAVDMAVQAWVSFVQKVCSTGGTLADPNAALLQENYSDTPRVHALIGFNQSAG